MWYGAALADIARYEEAQKAFETALTLVRDDESVFIYAQLGRMYERKGELDKAEDWFKKCIAESPDFTTGYIFLAGMLAKSGRLDEAEKYHREALSKDGSVDEAFLNLGYVLRAKEQYEEALICFQKA